MLDINAECLQFRINETAPALSSSQSRREESIKTNNCNLNLGEEETPPLRTVAEVENGDICR